MAVAGMLSLVIWNLDYLLKTVNKLSLLSNPKTAFRPTWVFSLNPHKHPILPSTQTPLNTSYTWPTESARPIVALPTAMSMLAPHATAGPGVQFVHIGPVVSAWTGGGVKLAPMWAIILNPLMDSFLFPFAVCGLIVVQGGPQVRSVGANLVGNN